MSRKKRSSSPPDFFDDELDEDTSSQGSRNGVPVQRNAANARERARMRVLSSAFGRLKTKLPNIPPDTKLSKLDTLRLATIYIKQLKAIVEGGGTSISEEHFDLGAGSELGGLFAFGSQGSHTMSWPFGFHHVHNSNRQYLNHNYTPSMAMEWPQGADNYPKQHRKSNTNSHNNGSNTNNNNSNSSTYDQLQQHHGSTDLTTSTHGSWYMSQQEPPMIAGYSVNANTGSGANFIFGDVPHHNQQRLLHSAHNLQQHPQPHQHHHLDQANHLHMAQQQQSVTTTIR